MMSLFTILLYTCLFSPLFIVYVFMCEISACLLTLSAHAREGYSSAFSVCLSVCENNIWELTPLALNVPVF